MASRKPNTNQNLVVNQVVIKTLNRQTQDIESWRKALKSADNNRRNLLYDLYEDILLDTRLSDAIDKRILAITNADMVFTVDDKEVDEIKELMESASFRTLLKEIMLAQFWGVTVLELDFTNGFNVFSIPRTHIRPDKKIITFRENDETGISFFDDPFLVPVFGDEKYGIILKTCPYVIYKRGNFGDWAQYAELFGMPFRLAKYDTFDEQTRILLTQAMEESGSASYAVIPKTGEIEYKDNKSSGDGGLYDLLRKACNEEITIGVLGQTLTTTQGEKGARSLGEVHLEVQESKHADDRKFVATILNSLIRPRLELRGYPVKGGNFKFPEKGENIGLKDRIEIDSKLDELIEIDPEYFYQTYGIPKPANGGGKKQKPVQTPPSNDPPKKEKLKLDDVSNEEQSWWKKLFSFFVAAPGSGANMSRTSIELVDVSKIIDVDTLVNEAIKNIFDTKGAELNEAGIHDTIFELTNKALQNGVETTFKKAGIDWGKKNVDFTRQFRENTAVFAAFKSHEQTRKIVELLTTENGSVRSFAEFKKEALKVSADYNKTWLQTEYNTAVRSARMAVNWKKFQETKHLYPNLEYLPSRAADPRDEHKVYYNQIWAMDDEIWDRIMPPSEWNCLCGVRQTDKPVTKLPSDWIEPETDPVFSNNPGKTARFVNTEETSYYKGASAALRGLIIAYAIAAIEAAEKAKEDES